MSKNDQWMPLYVGDYLADTMHLSAAEHGAYLLLLMHQWRTGPLPDDDRQLAAIARCDGPTWRRVGQTVRAFFVATDEGLSQARLERIRLTQDAKIAQRIAAGKASAEARKRQQEANENPTTVEAAVQRGGRELELELERKEKERTTSLRSVAPDEPAPDARTELFRNGLAEVRRLTGLTDGRARALLGKCLKAAEDNACAVSAAIANCANARPSDPVPWLLQSCQKPQFRNGFLALIADEGWASPDDEPEESTNQFLIERSPNGAH